MTAFLGVDGGGTKTAFCVVTDDGRIAGEVRATSTYYLGGADGVRVMGEVLAAGVREVCAIAGLGTDDIAHAFFALPGYGESSSRTADLDAAPRAALGHDRYSCGNDMVAGWAGSLGAQDGINVVAGTGSICYGEHDGRHVRVGGWSELFGDEGSGYWIAVRGLQAFSRMSDRRLAPGPLLDVVREHVGAGDELDVIGIVLGDWGSDRGKVAAMSRVVAQAADDGDAAARQILADAAGELAALVETAATRLGYADDEQVPVSCSGGVFSSPRVREEFATLLARATRRYDLREPLYPPAVGAALYAAHLAGTPLGRSARERLLEAVRATDV
ncbi:N-acetylglucosamine kinase [Cellulomonas alba]|uniref:BadF/BadG/BcrA/BcrD ATPase family protein n=1 Tax=Cellulomonas alba TaxID=3053467 RepID=A0ABT7SIK1_9CELL|nr:BadF/BadG/BcrA/BcrD ATPase family protein [Cellulomonas alba]MDM7856012.1 BadF/BadG/BcrA/BcrD ATPase family protein [Cellulomonas alba]